MELQLAVKALQFYTPDHPRVVEALDHLERTAASILGRTPRVTLTVAKGALLVDGEPFDNPNAQVKSFATDLEKRQVGGLIFVAGITRRELLEVVRLLAQRAEQLKAAGGAAEVLKRADVVHVRISQVRYEAVTEGEEVVWAASVRRVGEGDPVLVLPPMLQSLIAGDSTNLEDIRAKLEALANNDEQLTLLRERLVELGISREQFDELLGMLGWDRLSHDDRVARLLEGDRLFDFPAARLQHFLRELLDADRAPDVHRLLARAVDGLAHDAPAIRKNVCDSLSQLVASPLPRETEQLVGTALLNYFVREPGPQSAEAAANLLTTLVSSGRSEPALRVVEKLDATAPAAMPELARALGQRPAALVAEVCGADPESLARSVMPLVTRLGGVIAPAILEALGSEEDRNRRGRLVKALKAIGEPAFPSLADALRSPMWFVVRNALNVLGDVGTPALVEPIGRTLTHTDPRVRRAAARAVSKIGGSDAEKLLVGAINDRDAETQAEVLLCLGAMKAQSAVPALLEILKPKGFFARDTPAVRAAAERALAAIRSPR